jgi:hypothetical protein
MRYICNIGRLHEPKHHIRKVKKKERKKLQFSMERISPENKLVRYTLISILISTFISTLIASISTSTALVFGGRYCLLFVENYHADPPPDQFIFDAYSGTCSSNITMGWLAVIAIIGIAVTHVWMLRTSLIVIITNL